MAKRVKIEYPSMKEMEEYVEQKGHLLIKDGKKYLVMWKNGGETGWISYSRLRSLMKYMMRKSFRALSI